MNKLYSLLGIGLLSAATLNSCKEDAFTEKEGPIQQEKLQTYTTTASIRGHETTEKESSTRANVQEDGYSFTWNANDKITIWDGTNGNEFSAINYNGSEPARNVEFTGEGSFAEGTTVWGIYPKREAPASANAFVFTLGDNATQSGSKPELQNTMHILAKGTVSGTTVTNLNFEHLTALYQFSINNLSSDSYKVTSVSVSCETAIFPKELTVSGEEKTYDEKVKSLTLTMSDLTIAGKATSHGYMNFFPMADMTGDTELTFSVTVQKVGGNASEVITKEVKKISDLYNTESVVTKDGYKYVAGKRYGVSFTLNAELGYEETETNKYLVNTEEGLIQLASNAGIMTNTETVITLSKDLDWQGKEAWVPIADFKGTLDGNSKKISNFSIGLSGADAGLFISNEGTIQNLTIKNVTVAQATGIAGVIAAKNNGTIQNCVIDGGSIAASGSDAKMGALVGHNIGGSAVIANCRVEGTFEVKVPGGKANAGALVGINGNWNVATIKGSSVGDGVTVVFSGSADSAVGGLVGWNNQGKISGSYSLATVALQAATNAAGLVGANSGTIIASYAAGRITAISSINNFAAGGLVGSGGTVTGCYSATTLPASGSNNIGGISGKTSTSAVTASECYFMNREYAIGGNGNIAGTTKVNAAELRTKVASMNTAVSGSGFKFVEASPENDVAPLNIQEVM